MCGVTKYDQIIQKILFHHENRNLVLREPLKKNYRFVPTFNFKRRLSKPKLLIKQKIDNLE